MKTTKVRILTIFIIMLTISFSIIPFALAKQRKTYLTDFLLSCEIKDEGFSNSPEEEDDVSFDATAYAIEILDDYNMLITRDIWGEVENTVNTSDLMEYLEDKGKDRADDINIDIYKTYFILKALNTLEYETSSSLENSIETYLDSLDRSGNGFAAISTSSSASITSTYFAMMTYELIDEKIPNESAHKAWIRSCRNSDGGYGGNTTLSSSILNTFYAISIFEVIFDIDDLSDKDDTIEYLDSFYVDDEGDDDNYGGYLPDENAENALLSSTYYCIQGIYLIDKGDLDNEEETLNWVLNRQNFKDGGFSDNSDGDDQKESSITDSYFAYKTLMILDGKTLPSMELKVFMLEFIWVDWLILVILLTFLGVAVIYAIIIWRKRRI